MTAELAIEVIRHLVAKVQNLEITPTIGINSIATTLEGVDATKGESQ